MSRDGKTVSKDTDQLIAQKLGDDIESSKAERYEELQKDFVNDDITEQEFESELDDLFESGDDFLEHEPEADPRIDRDEARFRAREVAEIVGAAVGLSVFIYAVYITHGLALLLLVPIGLSYLFYKVGLLT